jgi:hypothetical protein
MPRAVFALVLAKKQRTIQRRKQLKSNGDSSEKDEGHEAVCPKKTGNDAAEQIRESASMI